MAKLIQITIYDICVHCAQQPQPSPPRYDQKQLYCFVASTTAKTTITAEHWLEANYYYYHHYHYYPLNVTINRQKSVTHKLGANIENKNSLDCVNKYPLDQGNCCNTAATTTTTILIKLHMKIWIIESTKK